MIKRDAIGRKLDDLVDGFGKRPTCLTRQAVNQIHIHGMKADLAGVRERIANQLEALHAIDRLKDT